MCRIDLFFFPYVRWFNYGEMQWFRSLFSFPLWRASGIFQHTFELENHYYNKMLIKLFIWKYVCWSQWDSSERQQHFYKEMGACNYFINTISVQQNYTPKEQNLGTFSTKTPQAFKNEVELVLLGRKDFQCGRPVFHFISDLSPIFFKKIKHTF